ncbi:restriction endonuclease subunit S [Fructobacillus ficulneus]|uniref:Type I restriction-modification system specificity subunit n=1 Tax=Fructobacillus ficulneus TaxID=157463 RepID=A0A0K8MJ34_9LACO|nr:restriction endonuclease subunit S [Fructobacillus ficulneus]GAO99899.1 type I restriction-modification system specificity subunit [Fructobacillus ficulneus]
MNKMVPNIRFAGFDDAWEQRKLEELIKVNSGRDYKHLNIGDIPVFGTGGYMTSVDEALSYDEDAIGIGRKGTINKPYILKAPFWTVDTLFYVVPRLNNDLNFLYDVFQSINWKKLDESTGVPSLSKLTINSVLSVVPEYTEQKKIGTLFKRLDNLITLHQRKLNLLIQQKKGMLQKMFPQNGEQVADVRFNNFNDAWEQRKLGEVLVQRTSKIAENDEYRLMSFVKDVGVVPKNERYDRSFLVKDEKKKYKITELGDFIYSSNNLESGSIGINKTGKALISPVYSVFSSKFGNSSVFIGLESKRKEFLNQMIRYRQGVTYGQWRIHEYDFLNLRLTIPNDEEQRKIIILFERLDNLITLHQRKLNLLEIQKKGFLQNMFV